MMYCCKCYHSLFNHGLLNNIFNSCMLHAIHCNEKGVTGLGTDGSPRMVPHGVSGPCWEQTKDKRVFVEVNLKYLGPFREQASSHTHTGKSRSGPKLVPEFFCHGHNFVPIPITRSQLNTFPLAVETWDQVGIMGLLYLLTLLPPGKKKTTIQLLPFNLLFTLLNKNCFEYRTLLRMQATQSHCVHGNFSVLPVQIFVIRLLFFACVPFSLVLDQERVCL